MIEGSAPTTGRSADVPETQTDGLEVLETREWLDSLDYVLYKGGPDRAGRLLQQLSLHARRQAGVNLPFTATTPYQNTIASRQQPPFPGSQEMERRIKSLVRWNALAMVVRANKVQEGIGGHISTFASSATLYEVAFNHFLHAKTESGDRDIVYFQGHAAPGMYARAYLEGRIPRQKLENFRRELKPGGGLSSYPHPWLMPDFWEFPTVSMGLGPIQAIYQARFIKYLENRGLKQATGGRVWAFLGDGEMDEPESLGSITLASRERLDNLIFVVNCNLQRLDGPVRGNGKIIQELESDFRGAGWNVIKVIWGTHWDALLARDKKGILERRMMECVDGEYQTFKSKDGAYVREYFFNTPELKYMRARRMELGGYLPSRRRKANPLTMPELSAFERFLKSTDDREISTTMAFVQILQMLIRDKNLGRHIVPIVPDESRTFGMEGMFRQLGIWNQQGQLYTPEDKDQLMFYKESKDGQILQEGISEAGGMCDWMAAATSYSTHAVPMIPFFIFYSMFGLQRVGDLTWAAGDMRCRGFLLGGTAGRTTLNGEGLQHEDGHSHLISATVPNCISYDPTFAYEVAVIIHHGLKRMYVEQHDAYFYLTLMNENYTHPAMPEGAAPAIVKGMYLFKAGDKKAKVPRVQLLGSGT